jgi:hypothetical protein
LRLTVPLLGQLPVFVCPFVPVTLRYWLPVDSISKKAWVGQLQFAALNDPDWAKAGTANDTARTAAAVWEVAVIVRFFMMTPVSLDGGSVLASPATAPSTDRLWCWSALKADPDWRTCRYHEQHRDPVDQLE